MVAFFKKGDGGKTATEQSPDRKPALDERERRIVLIFATAALLLIALIFLLFGGRGSALENCKGVLLQQQRNACFLSLAGSTGNASVCSYVDVQSERDACFVGMAEAENSISVCNEVNHTSAQYSACLNNVSLSTGNESGCQQLNGENQSLCAMNLATAEGFRSLSECSIIDNASLRNECSAVYQYNSALKSGSVRYCMNLTGAPNSTVLSLMLTDSYESTASTSMQGVLFDQLNVSPRGYCYYSLAKQLDNSTLCDQTAGLLNQACLAELLQSNATANTAANATNATEFCSLLQRNLSSSLPSDLGNFSSLCLHYTLTAEAISTKNISKCLQVGSAPSVDACITSYATDYYNASYCSYIYNSSAEQDCYMTVTLKKNQTG